MGGRSRAFALGGLVALGAAWLTSCTPVIGDKCVLSTDCSTRGDRLCDTSQPDGYCTQFNCRGDGCPDKAACVLFNAAIPGCGFDDRAGPGGSRDARSFCVAQCATNSDCRSGYVCADSRRPPWNGIVLDDQQVVLTCLPVPPGYDPDAGADAGFTPPPVCGPAAPDAGAIDASPPHIFDAGSVIVTPLVPDAGRDAGGDAGDAGDAGDGGDGG